MKNPKQLIVLTAILSSLITSSCTSSSINNVKQTTNVTDEVYTTEPIMIEEPYSCTGSKSFKSEFWIDHYRTCSSYSVDDDNLLTYSYTRGYEPDLHLYHVAPDDVFYERSYIELINGDMHGVTFYPPSVSRVVEDEWKYPTALYYFEDGNIYTNIRVSPHYIVGIYFDEKNCPDTDYIHGLIDTIEWECSGDTADAE